MVEEEFHVTITHPILDTKSHSLSQSSRQAIKSEPSVPLQDSSGANRRSSFGRLQRVGWRPVRDGIRIVNGER